MATANPSATQGSNKPSAGRIVPFGKYLLLQRVNAGGMAEIFKAVPEGATRLDNILAIKRILPSIAEDEEFIGMFVDEARIAGQLNHPNICRIYELGMVGETNYIAMQFLWGKDLLRVINRFKRVAHRTPAPLIAYVGAKASAGLHHAHTKHDANGHPLNIIHRDVSPQNIILGYSGQVKIIDFGVARAASQSQKTQAGVLKGKFGYMSPEIIKGHEIDARSDIFAMGICLWEGLTGQRLFYGESDFQTLELVREAKVLPPSSRCSDIPPELDAAVMKALAPDPKDRFADAGEMHAALEEVLARCYPGFAEADVALIMRQAFVHEVKRERQRLGMLEEMMRAGNLVRGAELPLLPPDPSEAGKTSSPASSEAKAPAEIAPAAMEEAELPGAGSGFQDIHEEATTIFFSAADELNEAPEPLAAPGSIREINPLKVEPDPSTAPAPHASDVLMPGDDRSPLDSGPLISPWTDLAAFRTLQESALASQEVSVSHGPNKHTAPGQNIPAVGGGSSRTRNATLRWVATVALVAGLGYATTRLARGKTGTLSIQASNASGAVVRLDGVMRGNLPLEISDLNSGVHLLEVSSPGRVSMRKQVLVRRGRTTLINLVLAPRAKAKPQPPKPLSYDIQPVVPSQPPTPSPTPPSRQRPKVPARGSAPRRTSGASQNRRTTAGANTTQPGELMISTLPWSRVFVDRVDTGRDTPVRSLQVPPGKHTLGLRMANGTMHEEQIIVRPGQTLRIIRQLK